MKIPKKIKVLGVEYKIIQQNKLKDDEGNISETQLGWCNEATRTIELATSNIFCESLKEQTFFHELVHAIMYESGLSRCIPRESDEVFAQCISNAVHQIYKQML